MKLKYILPLVGLFLAAASASAQFEGVMTMSVNMTNNTSGAGRDSKARLSIGKKGFRVETELRLGATSMTIVVLRRDDTPNIMYYLNEDAKTYYEFDSSKALDDSKLAKDEGGYAVRKLGEEKILGYNTQHILLLHTNSVTHRTSDREFWLAKDICSYETFSHMNNKPGSRISEENVFKALRAAGVDGVPLKMVMHSAEDMTVYMEVVKIDKKSLPDSTFEVPADFKKTAAPMAGGVGGAQTDAMRQQMQDRLKNLSPEQRARIEEMMKTRPGLSQPPSSNP